MQKIILVVTVLARNTHARPHTDRERGRRGRRGGREGEGERHRGERERQRERGDRGGRERETELYYTVRFRHECLGSKHPLTN